MNRHQIKLGAILVLIVLSVIVYFQNTEPVQVKLLFLTMSMSRAILLMMSTAFGFAIGVLFSLLWLRRRDKKEMKPAATAPPPPAPPEEPPAQGMTDPQI